MKTVIITNLVIGNAIIFGAGSWFGLFNIAVAILFTVAFAISAAIDLSRENRRRERRQAFNAGMRYAQKLSNVRK